MQNSAGLSSELHRGGQCNGFRNHWNGRQAETSCDLAIMRDAVLGKVAVLRAQPDPVTERGCVLHRTQQHACVSQGRIRLAERLASGLGQLVHFGQFRTLQPVCQRANREQPRLVQRPRTAFQHLDQTRFIERRISIRRASKAGNPAHNGRGHLRFQRRLVLVSGLAQTRRDIHQPGHHDQSAGIDRLIGNETPRGCTDRGDAPVDDVHVLPCIDAVLRVDQTAVCNQNVHTFAPASILITAILTAMPKVTCGRITECFPSATLESISIPRFIGPGCITIASGLACASFSSVSP